MTLYVEYVHENIQINYKVLGIESERMSYKAIYEIVLDLQSYKIIQLPYQGLFTFEISIYQDLGKKEKAFAIPYQIHRDAKVINNKQKVAESGLIEDRVYRSPVGIAKYSDEVLALGEIVQFRLEIDTFPDFNTENVILEINLRFANKSCQQEQKSVKKGTGLSHGKLIETLRLKINQIQNNLINYYEGQFKLPYLSFLNFNFMSYLFSYKFDKYYHSIEYFDKNKENTLTLSKKQQERQQIKNIQELIAFMIKYKHIQPINVYLYFYNAYLKKLWHGYYLIQDRMKQITKNIIQIDIQIPNRYKLFLHSPEHNLIQQEKTQEQNLKDYIENYNPPTNLTLEEILQEINQIKTYNFDILYKYLQFFKNYSLNTSKLKEQFYIYQREKYGERVFKSIKYVGENQIEPVGSVKQNIKISKFIRNKNVLIIEYPLELIEEDKYEKEIVFYEITKMKEEEGKKQQRKSVILWQEESMKEFNKKSGMEIMNEQYEKKVICSGMQQMSGGQRLQYSQKHMLVVLCHGFQGSSFDMVLVQRWIRETLPDAYFMISRCNESDTQEDIEKLGEKLSKEIKNYIKNYMEEYEQENVIINLVGHSMGGIIARASLKHLEQQYKYHFGFYCSLSSPHLGYLNGVNKLIKVGLWALRRWKTIVSLEQLSMQETSDPRHTFLYKLSKEGSLKYFRKIILLSSFQDSYVSWHSARISPHESKNSSSKVENEMVDNILKNNIYKATTHRLDVNFNVKTKNLDSFIGRTAHINLIIQESLFKLMGKTLPKLFELREFQAEQMFL